MKLKPEVQLKPGVKMKEMAKKMPPEVPSSNPEVKPYKASQKKYA